MLVDDHDLFDVRRRQTSNERAERSGVNFVDPSIRVRDGTLSMKREPISNLRCVMKNASPP